MAYQAYAPWGGTQAGGWGAIAAPSSGYYTPGNLYGGSRDYSGAPIVAGPGGYFDLNPQAAYTRQVAPFAGGTDPLSNWIRNQYSQVYQGFQAAQATNPNLSIQNYLQPFNQDYFQQRFMSQAPAIRGENNPLFGGGRLRWFLDNR